MTFLAPATPRGRANRQTAIRRSIERIDTADMVANILAVYETAVVTHGVPQGVHWYSTAHAIGRDIATTYGLSIEQGCGILAALSPSTDWDRNIDLAYTMAETGDCFHAYGDAVEKARAIRGGADPDVVLGGRKVRSFYRNILRPDRPGPVTVDRHAISIAMGRKVSDREAKMLERVGTYQLVAAAYRSAARRVGLAPHRMQSVTWDTWRSGPIGSTPPAWDMEF